LLQHCLDWFSVNRDKIKVGEVFEEGGRLWLTTSFKRRLLKACVFGADIDYLAVQVAQMSLFLKVLEDETQEALSTEKSLFPREKFLPDLDNNIIHANSLIPVSAYPEYINERYLAACNPVDLASLLSQTERGRGFDAVVGNPPWGADLGDVASAYLRTIHREVIVRMPDSYIYFTHLAMNTLLRRGGRLGLVLPGTFLNQADAEALRKHLLSHRVEAVADLGQGIFEGALNTASIVVACKTDKRDAGILINDVKAVEAALREAMIPKWTRIERSKWEECVAKGPGSTFFTGDLDRVAVMASARSIMGSLSGLIDDLGIQRGVVLREPTFP
jgi:hypothetical protein